MNGNCSVLNHYTALLVSSKKCSTMTIMIMMIMIIIILYICICCSFSCIHICVCVCVFVPGCSGAFRRVCVLTAPVVYTAVDPVMVVTHKHTMSVFPLLVTRVFPVMVI